MKAELIKRSKAKVKISRDIDGIALADEMKKGLTKKFLEDIAKLRKLKSHLAKQS